MKLAGKSNKQGTKPNAKNIPIEVTGFVTEEIKSKNGSTEMRGIKGIDLTNNEEVKVFLTNRGKEAENPKRKNVEMLEKGYKAFGQKLKLEEGGVAMIKNTFPLYGNENCYMGNWVDVLAYNKEQAEEKVTASEATTVVIQKENGKVKGDVYSFETDPENFIETDFNNYENALSEVISHTENVSGKPAFLVRLVNENNEIEDSPVLLRKNYDFDNQKPFEKQDYADYVKKFIEHKKGELENDNLKINIVPAERFTVTTKGLENDDPDETDSKKKSSVLNNFEIAEKSILKKFDDGEVEHYAKQAFFTQSVDDQGNKGSFANSISITDPYGKAFDPALLGDLQYSLEIKGDREAQESSQTAQQLEEQNAFQQASPEEGQPEEEDELDNENFAAAPF